MRKLKVGLLGGTFNPVHQGHLIIAEQALAQLQLDRVDFLPDFLPPHVDHKEAIAAHHRVAMLQLAIQKNERFGLELAEIERQGKSYSYDTMKELQTQHPNVEYYFIIGGDMVAYLDKWYRIADLIQLVTFVGVNRPETTAVSPYPVQWIKVPAFAVSSSLIRTNLSQGRAVRYLLPDLVLDYIKEHQLYGTR
ncbi:nicotinate-nucleotide adenylyltransferase [Fructilactobacillus carniphilus]|uniref:Probable nicotinate-nucleotide adenylyltransferase n=1 Tax=Fructilactobacillus carniphilus TaxID=2940297 RepID=A0ABY5BXE8_9LACO|nr:nicotinate-nucleotide adenylyltransferase [Fructilactobacillus carniphilus]USS91179.1 nicotinate-nucleotide adenylyltransferase [Fructilactobacillus carniphilus]